MRKKRGELRIKLTKKEKTKLKKETETEKMLLKKRLEQLQEEISRLKERMNAPNSPKELMQLKGEYDRLTEKQEWAKKRLNTIEKTGLPLTNTILQIILEPKINSEFVISKKSAEEGLRKKAAVYKEEEMKLQEQLKNATKEERKQIQQKIKKIRKKREEIRKILEAEYKRKHVKTDETLTTAEEKLKKLVKQELRLKEQLKKATKEERKQIQQKIKKIRKKREELSEELTVERQEQGAANTPSLKVEQKPHTLKEMKEYSENRAFLEAWEIDLLRKINPMGNNPKEDYLTALTAVNEEINKLESKPDEKRTPKDSKKLTALRVRKQELEQIIQGPTEEEKARLEKELEGVRSAMKKLDEEYWSGRNQQTETIALGEEAEKELRDKQRELQGLEEERNLLEMADKVSDEVNWELEKAHMLAEMKKQKKKH